MNILMCGGCCLNSPYCFCKDKTHKYFYIKSGISFDFQRFLVYEYIKKYNIDIVVFDITPSLFNKTYRESIDRIHEIYDITQFLNVQVFFVSLLLSWIAEFIHKEKYNLIKQEINNLNIPYGNIWEDIFCHNYSDIQTCYKDITSDGNHPKDMWLFAKYVIDFLHDNINIINKKKQVNILEYKQIDCCDMTYNKKIGYTTTQYCCNTKLKGWALFTNNILLNSEDYVEKPILEFDLKCKMFGIIFYKSDGSFKLKIDNDEYFIDTQQIKPPHYDFYRKNLEDNVIHHIQIYDVMGNIKLMKYFWRV